MFTKNANTHISIIIEYFIHLVKGSYEYFIIFIYDYSRYGYTYILCKKKSYVFDKFKEFKEVENDFFNINFGKFLIRHQLFDGM